MYQSARKIPGQQPVQTVRKVLAAMIAVVLICLLPLGKAMAEAIPALPEITPAVAVAFPELVSLRAALVAERNVLRDRTRQHNGTCSSVVEGGTQAAQCDRALEMLTDDINRHIKASKQFIAATIIKPMNALAKRLGWSADEQARLDTALNRLPFDSAPESTDIQIRQTWLDVQFRDQRQQFAQEAAHGDGPGFPGPSSGEQTRYQDCTIFALANAAGLPYGVVAARATKLIGEGEWGDAAERADPQKAIEQKGLIGGEVIMLAEALGQVEVVRSTDFAKTLKEGRPVLVNVVPSDGNFDKGHQVVLTKTFQHGGEPWYEMMDSNQASLRRLYLSARELNTLLQENGVAFRPEPGTTPKLFRKGDQ